MTNDPQRPNLRERLRSRKVERAVSGERRTVTALFCDVTGSTTMAEQLDPEEWAGIMNEAFAHMSAPVDRYGGVVTRLMGDAILAIFGAPLAHEDDPVRAVRAGLEIVSGFAPFIQEIKQELGFDFNVRVGINTGPVVVGDIGSQVATSYTVMGDTVNVAARMEQTAAPGTVQITEHTYRTAAPFFEADPLGGVEVKGKAEPVGAYRVRGVKARPGPARMSLVRDQHVVGRVQELDALRTAMDELRRGRGQIVTLIGEAGLGKSRLLVETRSVWANDDAWAEARGIAYETGLPYGLLAQIVRALVRVGADDAPGLVQERLGAVLADVEALERARTLESLAMLLQAGQAAPEAMGEAVKRQLYAAVARLVQAVADEPCILVFDDLHWCDPASGELLLDLFRLTEELPVLFLCAFRPERQSPAWRIKQAGETDYPHRYTELALRPLSEDDAQELIRERLEVDELPAQVRDLILDKAEGNPFFVEEIVRTLVESGAVVRGEGGARWDARAGRGFTLPDSLQALLAARIDRLEPGPRRTLQAASIIGRVFGLPVLTQVCEDPAALPRELGGLQRVELVREIARLPETEYAFRHELTRQTAYETILLQTKRALHRRVGEAIEQIYGGRTDEMVHRLAYHFREGQDDERTLRYAMAAGDAAARLYANDEAAELYGHAVAAALSTGVEETLVGALYGRLGRCLELASRQDEALARYQELERLAGERASRVLELAALVPQATLYSTLNALMDPEKGMRVAKRALAIAEELGDARGQAKALWDLMLASYYSFETSASAIPYGERAIAVARAAGLKEELAYALNDISRPYYESGQPERGRQVQEEAAGLWRELGNQPMLADNLDSGAMYIGLMGDRQTPQRLLAESLAINRAIGNVWGESGSLVTASYIATEEGNLREALELAEQARERSVRAGFAGGESFAREMRAWLYGQLGDWTSAAEETRLLVGNASLASLPRVWWVVARLERALYGGEEMTLAEFDEMLASLAGSRINRLLEVLLLLVGEVAEARGWHQSLLRFSQERTAMKRAVGNHVGLTDTLYLAGMAHEGLGQVNEARAAYAEALVEGEAVNLRRSLWPVLARLARMEAALGEVEGAVRHREGAREIVRHIVANAGSQESAASFSALPLVREVLGAG